MDAFDYEALTADGKTSKGTIMAANGRMARRELRTRGLTPLSMSAAAPKKSGAKSGKRTVSGAVKPKLLTQATRQLSILVKSGTPVAEALRVTAMQFDGTPMRASLLDVRSHILEGRRLSEAMAKDKKTYSRLYRSMIAAGEDAGTLGAVMQRLAADLESAQKVRRRILGAIVYPIMLSIIAIAVICILMIYVVPKVAKQFDTFDQELPLLTRITIGMSEGLQSYGLIAGAAIAGLAIGVWWLMKLAPVRRRWHRLFLRLPLFGRLSRDVNAARFSRTMSGLLSSGAPLMSALNTSENTLRNLVMADAMQIVAEQVRTGKSLGGALKAQTVFPPLMSHMVASGEASGELAEMFRLSAEYLEGEFDGTTNIVLNLLQPAIIVLLGGVVLFIVAAIFLPILQLNTMAF